MPTDNLIRSDNFGFTFNLDANVGMIILLLVGVASPLENRDIWIDRIY
jgi:hypothetical protein